MGRSRARRQVALKTVKESIALYRRLTGSGPHQATAIIATSLLICGVVLTELGHHRDALAVDREVVTLYRELHMTHPEWYRDDLLEALRHVAVDLRALGLDPDAELAERERQSPRTVET